MVVTPCTTKVAPKPSYKPHTHQGYKRKYSTPIATPKYTPRTQYIPSPCTSSAGSSTNKNTIPNPGGNPILVGNEPSAPGGNGQSSSVFNSIPTTIPTTTQGDSSSSTLVSTPAATTSSAAGALVSDSKMPLSTLLAILIPIALVFFALAAYFVYSRKSKEPQPAVPDTNIWGSDQPRLPPNATSILSSGSGGGSKMMMAPSSTSQFGISNRVDKIPTALGAFAVAGRTGQNMAQRSGSEKMNYSNVARNVTSKPIARDLPKRQSNSEYSEYAYSQHTMNPHTSVYSEFSLGNYYDSKEYNTNSFFTNLEKNENRSFISDVSSSDILSKGEGSEVEATLIGSSTIVSGMKDNQTDVSTKVAATPPVTKVDPLLLNRSVEPLVTNVYTAAPIIEKFDTKKPSSDVGPKEDKKAFPVNLVSDQPGKFQLEQSNSFKVTKFEDPDDDLEDLDEYAPPAPTSHVVICTYDPDYPDELYLQVGDLIGIEKEYGDGWARGQNISRARKRGLFPLAIVNAITSGPSQAVRRGRGNVFRSMAQEGQVELDPIPPRSKSLKRLEKLLRRNTRMSKLSMLSSESESSLKKV